MNVLGINAYHGDASAAVICDGKLVAAAEEERFNRVKHIAGFPHNAVRYCIEQAGIEPGEIDHPGQRGDVGDLVVGQHELGEIRQPSQC